MKKIKPKCIPYNENLEYTDCVGNFPNFTSAGFLLPCCWLDHVPMLKENYQNLWDEELNIKNVNSIDDIFYSKQWKNFYKMLLNEQERAHDICWKNCGVEVDDD